MGKGRNQRTEGKREKGVVEEKDRGKKGLWTFSERKEQKKEAEKEGLSMFKENPKRRLGRFCHMSH